MGIRRSLVRYGAMVVIALLCLEIASCVGGRVMLARGLFYQPDEHLGGLATYLAERDPVLGWPKLTEPGTCEYDALGSRIVDAFPDPAVAPCVSVYGDSFAWSEEVDGAHAWSNVVSLRARCRVSNYGVPGYGTDQAYLRYTRNQHDRAPVVVLTHLSENIVRNVNRFRSLISHGSPWSFKPRFLVDARGELELVPIPTPASEADLRDLLATPEHLAHEYFVPGGEAGITRLTFPYSLSVVRDRKNWRLRDALAGEPSHAAFYDSTHPAGGLAVSTGIARAFVQEAKARGASPFVVIIPLPADFTRYDKRGRWAYAPFMEELERAGIPYLDAGDRFRAFLHGRNPCSLYKRCAGGHFTEEGYQILGEAVHAFLQERGALPAQPRPPSP